MKKKITAAVIVATLGLASVHTAMAGWGQVNNACVNCPQQNTRVILDQATQDKIAKFYTDNQELKKSIVVKSSELRAMMKSENPDPEKVGALSGELFDLKIELQNKAKEAGVDQYISLGNKDGKRGKGGKGGNRGGGQGQGGGRM